MDELIVNLDTTCKRYSGTTSIIRKPMAVYDELVCDFLDNLSKLLRKNPETVKYPDVMTFAFWCRKGNIQKIKANRKQDIIASGRGLVFHIAPSNVPVNFAFSFAFGLLSGNANIVRVPSKEFEQTRLVCDAIEELFQQDKYCGIARQNLILSYDRDSSMTGQLSELCDIRVIWGGDDTIQNIRKSPLKPKATELVFADRYSFGVIDSAALKASSEEELHRLAEGFYNDTYSMDQNACSTPHMIFFLQGKEKADNKKAKARFWEAVYEVAAKRYALEDIKVSDKYVELCKAALKQPECRLALKAENVLYVLDVPRLSGCCMTKYRGQFGLFYQHNIKSLEEIVPYVEQKVQSMMYYGVSKEALASFVIENRMMGIDRIVPFGSAMDIGVFWDGYDIITQMSRRIDLQ